MKLCAPVKVLIGRGCQLISGALRGSEWELVSPRPSPFDDAYESVENIEGLIGCGERRRGDRPR